MSGEPGRSAPGLIGNERLTAATPANGRETAVLDLLESSTGNDPRALRAVLRVSQAVLGAHRLDEALEVIADQSLLALDAASFSISRWERERGVLRTLINAGELGPGRGALATGRALSAGPLRRRGGAAAPGPPLRHRGRRPRRRPRRDEPAARPREGERAGRAGHVRVRDVGRAVGDRRARPTLRRRRRAPVEGDRRPGVGGDRPRGAVQRGLAVRLRGPAHAAGQPPRAGRAPARAGDRAARPRRCSSATSTA